MDELRHWRPVLLERDLRASPVALTIGSRELVLFRGGAQKQIGVIEDRCAHRGMRLSRGCVEGERLVCPYHAWSYDGAGRADSPSDADLRACVESYEVATQHGAIWVRAGGGAATDTPGFELGGMYLAHVLYRHVRAPLELLVDNFNELEHSCITHRWFGFDRARMSEVEIQTTVLEDGIHVRYLGPHKRVPWYVERAFRMKSGDRLVVEWTLQPSPAHVRCSYAYFDPRTGAERPLRAQHHAYFMRTGEKQSLLCNFYLTSLPPSPMVNLFMPLYRRWIEREYERDRRLLEHIVGLQTDFEGMRLGRFDKPLVEFRRALRCTEDQRIKSERLAMRADSFD